MSLLVHEYDAELPALPTGYSWSIIRPRETHPNEGYQTTIQRHGRSIGVFAHTKRAEHPDERAAVLWMAHELLRQIEAM